VQTVTADRHPELHGVLSAFHRRTGCPVVVNTSFNRAGEPIVATVEQAVRSAAAGGVDLLSIGSALVDGEVLESWSR
jgi:carbamoyltransferase